MVFVCTNQKWLSHLGFNDKKLGGQNYSLKKMRKSRILIWVSIITWRANQIKMFLK